MAMLFALILSALVLAISAVPCPFNEQECTCQGNAQFITSGRCNFKTGNSPNFLKPYKQYIGEFLMQHANDMSLPDNAFENVPSLTDMHIVNTNITTIGEKSFAGLKRLADLYIDRFTDENLNAFKKPLADLPSLNQFYLTKSTFKEVDLAVFSESTSRDLDVYFREIETIKYTPTEKYVYDLEFKAYVATIQNIDKSVADLLKKQLRTRLLFSGSKFGPCENFDWIADLDYLTCFKIDISGVTCAKNGKRVSLTQHLISINPNPRGCF